MMPHPTSRTAWGSLVEPITTHAEEAYPLEACGLVLESPDGLRYQRCANLAENPARRFVLDPLELVRAEDRGEQLRAIVHSHPDGSDDFSVADTRSATAAGAPLFADVSYLVVAMRGASAMAISEFRWDETRSTFCRSERLAV